MLIESGLVLPGKKPLEIGGQPFLKMSALHYSTLIVF
jgi:hypothetical protein